MRLKTDRVVRRTLHMTADVTNYIVLMLTISVFESTLLMTYHWTLILLIVLSTGGDEGGMLCDVRIDLKAVS